MIKDLEKLLRKKIIRHTNSSSWERREWDKYLQKRTQVCREKTSRENKQSSLHKELQHIRQNSLVTGSLQKNTAAILHSSHCMDLHCAAGDA